MGNERGFRKHGHKDRLRPLLRVQGNVVRKVLRGVGGDVVLAQTFESFWSYRKEGKRTQFIFESYKGTDGFAYKVVVADDPMSAHTFCGDDSRAVLRKVRECYPPRMRDDVALFADKLAYFL